MKQLSLLVSIWSLSFIMAAPPNDPLDKPRVWDFLISNPFDSALWTMYLDKPWVSWSVSDYNYQSKLQAVVVRLSEKRDQERPTKLTESEETFWGLEENEERDLKSSQQAFIESQRLQEFEYEKAFRSYLKESEALTRDLEDNIRHNFFLIEDILHREFEHLKMPYKSYLESHPDGKFDKAEWIEEQKQILRKYRAKRKK